jgi:hypothetical protein
MSYRIEEKISIPKARIIDFLDWIYFNGGKELYNERIVSSTYFDNDNLDMFSESEEGVVPRKKIRIRSYTIDKHIENNSNLEVKISSIEGRYKTISKVSNISNLMNCGFFDQDYGVCKPVVRVTYHRKYYAVFGVRFTIDSGIRYSRIMPGGRLSKSSVKDNDVIVEIKASKHTSIEYLNRIAPYPRFRFSKYARAMLVTQ